MKSNICTLNKESMDLNKLLHEVEKTAQYNDLTVKQTLHLRLLAEELIGMLPELLEYCEGIFWLENNGSQYELHVKVSPTGWDAETRKRLLSISTSGKNSAVKGVMGKVHAAIEYMLYGAGEKDMVVDPIESYNFYNIGLSANTYYYNYWSLSNYRSGIEENKDSNSEPWDELEKSIIANLADDVMVGFLDDTVDVIVKKNFK